MKHIKTLKNLASATGVGAILAVGLAACSSGEQTSEQSQIQKQGATVFIEKTGDKNYKIADEFPSNETRVFLREPSGDGNMKERLLSQSEIDAILAEENAKIDAGTSGLTSQNAQLSGGGMGLGEAILASAAGAIIGSWIGSKLFNNPAYQNSRQTAYKNPSAYNKSVNSFKSGAANKAGSAGGKSGFFGGNKAASSAGSLATGG